LVKSATRDRRHGPLTHVIGIIQIKRIRDKLNSQTNSEFKNTPRELPQKTGRNVSNLSKFQRKAVSHAPPVDSQQHSFTFASGNSNPLIYTGRPFTRWRHVHLSQRRVINSCRIAVCCCVDEIKISLLSFLFGNRAQ
jgi:hypothetical protein